MMLNIKKLYNFNIVQLFFIHYIMFILIHIIIIRVKQPMKVCVIGGGPSGIYIGRYLAKNNILVHIYEKESKPFGLERTLFSPEKRGKLKFKENENLKIFYNSPVDLNLDKNKTQNFENKNRGIYNKNINILDLKEKKYDLFVIATGGKENKLKIPGGEYATPSSKIIDTYKPLSGDICIIGMGDVTMDIIRNLRGYETITALSRKNIFNSKFTNSEFSKIIKFKPRFFINFFDKFLMYIHKILPRKIKRTYELITSIKNNGLLNIRNQNKIKLYFNTKPLSIEKMNNRLLLRTNTFSREFDHIISAIGYSKKNYEGLKKLNKPYFVTGWAKLGHGNLTDMYFDAISTGSRILKMFK